MNHKPLCDTKVKGKMQMLKYYSVGEAAKAAHMTSEALRHYDRIGLVKPGKKDPWTGCRYYTDQDIVRLNAVRALQGVGLPLQTIKEVLECDDLEAIANALAQAEARTAEKIAELQRSKARLRLARADYEGKLQARSARDGARVRKFPRRIILPSDALEVPALENLWNYLGHFYGLVPPALRDQFAFEDQAGIYTGGGVSRLFAVCTRHAEMEGLKALPEGKYLCAQCGEENREAVLAELTRSARTQCGAAPAFTLQFIVVSGILRWNYEVQVPVEA